MRGKRLEAELIEDNFLIDEEELSKIIGNFTNNTGHLNGIIPEGEIWLSSSWGECRDESEKNIRQDK